MMATQGRHHMGGTKRYVKGLINPMNIPASRANLVEKTPVVNKKSKPSVMTTIADQPTRAMLGIKSIVKKKGGK